MSVTFEAQMSVITGWTVRCACGDGAGPTFGDYQDGYAYLTMMIEDESLRVALPGCEDPETCLMYRLCLTAREEDPSPSINMSNTNSLDLFDALGLNTCSVDAYGKTIVESPWDGGSVPAADFMGRVLLAMAVMQSDSGQSEIGRVESASDVICAQRLGYVNGRLADMHQLAEFAVARSLPVNWF